MTAIVLPDIDRPTFEDLRERMPSLRLSEIELPSIERAGRDTVRTIDRVLGRSRPTVWPWIAAALGIAAVAGIGVALLSWARRPMWAGGLARDDDAGAGARSGGETFNADGDAAVTGARPADWVGGDAESEDAAPAYESAYALDVGRDATSPWPEGRRP